jgi:hypothetical protein
MESTSTFALSYEVSQNADSSQEDRKESPKKMKESDLCLKSEEGDGPENAHFVSGNNVTDSAPDDEQINRLFASSERKPIKKVRAKSLMISSSLSLLPAEVTDNILHGDSSIATARTEQEGKNRKEHSLLSESTVIYLPFENKNVRKSRTKSFLQFHPHLPHSPTDDHPAFIEDPKEVIVATKLSSSSPVSLLLSASSSSNSSASSSSMVSVSSFPFRRRHSRAHIDLPFISLLHEK